MHFTTPLSHVLVALLTLASCCHAVSLSPQKNPLCSSIQWEPCPGNTQFDCSSFHVPLDYAQPAVGNATLSVARFKAIKQPRLGTIFTNPGGPGGSGVGFLMEGAGEFISAITEGQYDIVSWDPRGVNQSRPQISCGFTSSASLAQFFGNTIPGVGIEARGNFSDRDDVDAFFARVNETDAKIVQTGQQCLENDGAFLKYMGTAAVVRDIVSMSDCLEGPDKAINYWGFSYGTVIGNYFVNMFPERVGRVIIDGVVDTIVWATEPSFKMAAVSFAAVESVLTGFADKCALAGPQNCTIAQNHSTPESILQGIRQLIDNAYDLHKQGHSNLTSFDVREFIDNTMFSPLTWDATLVPQLEEWAEMFENSSTGNAHNLSQLSPSILRPRTLEFRHNNILSSRASNETVDPAVQTFLSELVISCVDSIDQENVTTERLFEELLRVTQEVSPTFGEVVVTAGQAFCHRFPVRAVERFTGPFNHRLSNPILVIGNKADPITPLANAQRIAATLGQSARLLEQDGLGHTSIAENSDCTQDVARQYLLHGVLPHEGQVCMTDQALFPPNNALTSPNSNP